MLTLALAFWTGKDVKQAEPDGHAGPDESRGASRVAGVVAVAGEAVEALSVARRSQAATR